MKKPVRRLWRVLLALFVGFFVSLIVFLVSRHLGAAPLISYVVCLPIGLMVGVIAGLTTIRGVRIVFRLDVFKNIFNFVGDAWYLIKQMFQT
ncbi:MAG: hypothetical protein WC249_00225 [Patescibacteria group bacterium]|jgi:hypothetical protein